MNNSQQNIKKLLWFSLGFMNNMLYVIIILALLYSSNLDVNPNDVLPTFLPLIGLSLILSGFIIYKGLSKDKALYWGITWLAIFQTPSIIGLILAFIQINQ